MPDSGGTGTNPQREAPTRKEKARALLAFGSVVAVLIAVLWAGIYYATTPPPNSLPNLPYNDFTKLAIEHRAEQAKTVFQTLLVLTGVLIGLLLAKPGEVTVLLEDWQEVTMVVCCALLLVGSFVFHQLHLNQFLRAYKHGAWVYDEKKPSIPDVFHENIEWFFVAEWSMLLVGSVVAFCVLLSAHKLKEP